MDIERKINLSEGIPLNSECPTNVVFNTGNGTKLNSSTNGTVIHLKSDKSSANEVGLHINTTFSIVSSKKVKLLFVLNFLLSVICMIISCSVAFYYWNELTSMRHQLDLIKDQLLAHSLGAPTEHASPLVLPRPGGHEPVPRRAGQRALEEGTGKKYYVDGLEEDLHFYGNKEGESAAGDVTVLQRRDLAVAHFVGGGLEKNLRDESKIGPWALDYKASTKDAMQLVTLTELKYLNIREGGLYLIYAQVLYKTNAPNVFYVWAQKRPEDLRLLSTCASGDVATRRPLRQSQITCSLVTVARLAEGDQLHFAQRERNSTVLLMSGSSYFGLIKLSS